MNESHRYLHLLLQEPIYLISDAAATKESSVATEPQPSIVATAEAPAAAVPPSPLKPLAVFTDAATFDALPESQRNMLGKLLQAAKVDMATTEFLPNTAFAGKAEYYKKCMVFNSALGETKYSIIQRAQSQVLIADSLSDLENKVELKKQLWPQVQKLFGLV